MPLELWPRSYVGGVVWRGNETDPHCQRSRAFKRLL
jgi:hypothetical protein